VKEVAALLGLGDLLDRRPWGLSGGQQQRVALGRALVRRPACFLMDEPLAHLDAGLRLTTRTEIRQLQRQFGTTTLYVTHDPDEAMALADHVAVLSGGRLVQVGPPRELYRRPASRFVLTFFGPNPANVIDGEVIPDGDGVAFVGGLRVKLPGAAVRPGPVVLGFRAE